MGLPIYRIDSHPRGLRGSPSWPSSWTEDYLSSFIAEAQTHSDPTPDLVFSLMIDPCLSVHSHLWRVLRSAAETISQPLPLAVDWRRALAYARVHWSDRRFIVATRLAAEAERQVRHLATLNAPDCAELFLPRAQVAIASLALGLPPVSAKLTFVARATAQPCASDFDRSTGDIWRRELALGASNSHTVVISAYERELEVFAARVAGLTAKAPIWAHAQARDSHFRPRDIVFVLLTTVHGSARLRDHLQGLAGHVNSGGATLLLTTFPFHALRTGGPDLRALLELLDGPVIPLPALLARRNDRLQLIRSTLHIQPAGPVVLDDSALHALADYDWPGGLAELETMAAAILSQSARPVTTRTLEALGWDDRTSRSTGSIAMSLVAAVLHYLEPESWRSSRDVARALQKPSRTVIRALAVMYRRGLIERRGRGRATRYAVRIDRASDPAHA